MNSNIVRALKGDFYRQSFNDEERARLAGNPVGELDLTDDELGDVFAAGGRDHSYNQFDACTGNNFSQGGCYTHHRRECERPRFSHDWNNCGGNRYTDCHSSNSYNSYNSYQGDNDDCRTYGGQH